MTGPGPDDDRELVAAAQGKETPGHQGDTVAGPGQRTQAHQEKRLAAFEELVRRHQRPLFGYLYRMCANPAEAEELVQQAFVKAWGGIGRFRGDASFKTWLYRIATNLCINRATRRKPTVELPESLPAPEASEPAESYARARRIAAVRAALDRLPEDQRAALVLVEYEEMSYRDAAQALGRSVRAVDSLIFRARQNLRRLLEPARRKGIV